MSRERGPAVARLADYVRGSQPEQLAEAAESWTETVRDLNDTRATLRWAARLIEERLSGDYAVSATRHLDQLAEVTIERQREVRQAARTLQASSDALLHAREVFEAARADEAGNGSGQQAVLVGRMSTYFDPYSEEAIERDRYRAQQQRHDDRTFDGHEQRAAAETTYLDHVFDQTTDRMREVEKTRTSEVADGGTYDIDDPVRRPPPVHPKPGEPVHPGEPHPVHPGYPIDPSHPSDPLAASPLPGSPQGPGTSTAPLVPGTSVPSTSGGGLGVPASGLALGAGGLGAGALAGGLRAGGLPGLSAQGVRGIGTSGSTGTTGGAGSRTGGVGSRTGGAGGRSGPSGRSGRAGSRSGAGSAGGRSGRRKDEREHDERDGIDEDPEQWLEDDVTGPRVMSAVTAAAGPVARTDAGGPAAPDAPADGPTAPDGVDADLEAELDDVLADLDLDVDDDVDLAGWLAEPDDAPDARTPTAPREGPPRASRP